MKKKLLIGSLIICLISLGISGCSSNNTAGGQVNPNGSVTVKYEIILSSPLIPLAPNAATPSIWYKNGTVQDENANDFNYGSSSWTKTVNMTATRPCWASLECSDGLFMNTPGTVTANIYINGVVKATQTNPTQVASGLYFGIVQLNYLIQ